MPQIVLERPGSSDHAPYYSRYTDLVPAGNLLDIMMKQEGMLRALLAPLSDEQTKRTYAPEKWTVRELVGHLIDTERVFSYRAIAFSRADPSPLPGFNQAEWLPYGGYNARQMSDILDEWSTTRAASIAMLRAMPAESLSRKGIASDASIRVLACVTILPGHVFYHLNHLKEVYLHAIS